MIFFARKMALNKKIHQRKFLMDLYVYELIFYFNKSKTKDGNKPKAMFKAIEITAVA
jgi:hypothetical protein